MNTSTQTVTLDHIVKSGATARYGRPQIEYHCSVVANVTTIELDDKGWTDVQVSVVSVDLREVVLFAPPCFDTGVIIDGRDENYRSFMVQTECWCIDQLAKCDEFYAAAVKAAEAAESTPGVTG